MLCSKKPNELYPIPCVSHWVLRINTLSVKFLPEVSKVYVLHGFELGVYGTNYILLHYTTLHYTTLHGFDGTGYLFREFGHMISKVQSFLLPSLAIFRLVMCKQTHGVC